MQRKQSPILPLAGCLAAQLCVGIIYLWSVLSTPVAEAFSWSIPEAKMVSSYMIFAFVAGNLIGGYANDKKGPRFTAAMGILLFSAGIALTGMLTEKTINLLYVTYAGIGGLGSGFVYSSCISCAQKWLPDRRGLASGLAVSSFGLSTVVFAPASKWLMNIYADPVTGIVDFQPVFLILACIFLVVGSTACFFIRLPAETQAGKPIAAQPEQAINYTLAQSVKTIPFWCLFLTIFFINGTWNLTVPLIYDLGISRGLTVTAATIAVSLTGIPNSAGRLIMAALSDKLGRAKTITLLSALTLLCAILMTFVGGYMYIVVVSVIAFAYGGPSAVNAAFSTDFFGAKNSGTNYGVIMLALGLSSVFFNIVSNKLLGGAVVPTFIMAAVTAVIPLILMAIIHRYQSRSEAQTQIKIAVVSAGSHANAAVSNSNPA